MPIPHTFPALATARKILPSVTPAARVHLAQKELTAEQRKYELGAQTIFFLLDAQTKLAQAESSLLQAQITYQIAVPAVDQATGGLLQPYRVQVAELSQ